MARLKNANKALKYDKRLARYNLVSGALSKEEHDQRINDLPDLSDECVFLKIDGESLAKEIPLSRNPEPGYE